MGHFAFENGWNQFDLSVVKDDMDQAKELFGLILILAFTALMPGFVKTCPNCIGANLPTKISSTSIILFSGSVESVESKPVTIDEEAGTLTTYDVRATMTWLGWGKQSADLQLSRVNSNRGCLFSAGNNMHSGLFFVIGPPHDTPYLWVCL